MIIALTLALSFVVAEPRVPLPQPRPDVLMRPSPLLMPPHRYCTKFYGGRWHCRNPDRTPTWGPRR